MAAYMIFVEGRQHGGGLVAELGLADIERGESQLTWQESQTGPGGAAGVLGYWLDLASGSEHYRPETQVWRQAPGKKFWVGTHCNRPLVPADIERVNWPKTSYLPVRLEDGNRWKIPTAKFLPHVWGLDDEGQFDRQPRPEFAAYCALAEPVYQMFVSHAQDDYAENVLAHWDFACQSLSIVYRLAPPIVSALGLVGDRTGWELLAATVNLRAIQDVVEQKKTTERATTPSTSVT